MTSSTSAKSKVTAEEICDALSTVVSLMDKLDQDLWPLFERLERELDQVESREAKMAKYRRPITAKPKQTPFSLTRRGSGALPRYS